MNDKHIITVSELKQICEEAEKEFGPDALVRIQIRDEIGRLIEQDYCVNTFTKAYDILVLTNYKFELE